jgi:[protein-PII] uridylyltransferase
VNDLVQRVKRVMAGAEVAQQPEISEEQKAMAERGQLRVTVEEHSSGYAVEVISPDKPGLLSIVAGVFSISRLDVKSARTKTLEKSAVMSWIVTPEPHAPEISEAKLHEAIAAVLLDSKDVEERLISRAAAYASIPAIPVPDPEVEVFTDAATDATVIEVRSHDRPGLLFRIGAAITQSKIDIRSAIVTTLGAEAIDTLYVTELSGGPLSSERAAEVASHLKQALK